MTSAGGFRSAQPPDDVQPGHRIARKPVPDRSSTQYSALTPETSPSSPDTSKCEGRVNVSEQRHAKWRPQWLRPHSLASFAGLFLCFSIALPAMLWYSRQHDGIAKTRQDYGYVWRFGPTAVLTIVAAFWARVELQAMRYMPWIALRRGQSPDYDLDYTSMLMPTVLYASLRRKHWLVLLVSVVSLLIRAEIVLAPGLFQLTPVQHAEPINITMADSFSLTWGTDTGYEAIIAYYAARAVHDFNMTYPFGVTKEAAYQTFELADTGRRGNTSAPVKAEVDAFFMDIECLKAKEVSALDIGRVARGPYEVDVSFQFEGCQQDVSFTQTTVQSPDSWDIEGKVYDSWQLANDLLPNSRPCANLPQQNYQFIYFAGQYVNGTSVNSSRPVELAKADAILCSPTAWISKVEVTDDGISPNLTVLPDQDVRPIEADTWGILAKAMPTTPGTWKFVPRTGDDQLNYGPVKGELSFSEQRANFSNTTELLYNCTVSLTRRLGPLVGHYLFRQNNTDKSEAVAEVFVVIDRLALNPQVCWAIFAVSALITAIIGLSLFRSRRYTTVWHRDPATVLGHLLFLSDHPELRETEPNRDDDRSWSHGTFSPIVLRPWAQIAFAIFVCGLLIGLGSTLQQSEAHRGLATVDEKGYWYLLWTSFPSLIMLGVSLYTSSCDFVLRGLSTLHSLSTRPCDSRLLDFSMLDILGLRALWKSSQQRLWTITTSQLTVLFCGFLATLATVLFSVETVISPVEVQLQQQSWFGDTLIDNNTDIPAHTRENIRSLLARRGEANFTYPKNTYADMAFPVLDMSQLSVANSARQVTVQFKVPAARLVSSCERLPEARFNVSVMNYTEQVSQNTSETVYQGPMLIKEKCPTGNTNNLGHLFIFGRNQTGAHSGRSNFADILASPGNLYDMNQPCRLNITDVNELLRPTMQQTYVWGQWNYDKYDFDLLRFWRCDYSWGQVMTDVTMVKGADGEFAIDQTRPPVPDLSTTKKMHHPFDVPVWNYQDLMVVGATAAFFGNVAPEIIVTDPSAGDINAFFRPLIQPYGKLPIEAFGDPEWENVILEELHTNLGFASAQLANVEYRLDVGQDSRTTPFPAEGLPAVEALVIDGGQRRLVQNATVTYLIIGILGLVALVILWTLFSRVMRMCGVKRDWFAMDVKGLAPDGFGSIGAMTSLLRDSNAMDHVPSQSERVSTADIHEMLKGLWFRLGWFNREADQRRHFTVGVLEDKKFSWVESKIEAETGEKSMYERVVNTSEETAYRGGGP
ncbi:hypothetical protein CKAH01_14734 [Colletotrichum kahawae]|uniref:Uncharacterized protein n=1 Tax=Colletotrichum kahawae TaxID=34407 RepID=A0AAD9YLD3_COLKA|nr:hypothetical protein CKAH01_14734 [Colletotrichum kahawae]